MHSNLPADTRPPPASSFGRISIDSVTTRLVIVTVGVFILDRLLFRQGIRFREVVTPDMTVGEMIPLIGLAHFSIGMAFIKMELWRLVTWPFVHFNPWHLAINVVGLHCFGPLLESHYGPRRFFIFYMLCAMGGVVAYAMLWGTSYLIDSKWMPMFSASAPVLGLLVAAAHVAPDATATIYDLIPIRLRNLALALLGLALMAEFRWGAATLGPAGAATPVAISIGGAAAHLGGAAMGLALIRAPQWVRLFDWRPWRRPPPF